MAEEYWDKIRKQPTIEKYYSPNNIFGWIWIPKNGTNTISHALCKHLRWHKNRDIVRGTKFFGMIRDPIERWASGTAVLTRRNQLEWVRKLIENDDIQWLVDRRWHDIHTAPQSWYYQNIPNLTLFEFPRFDQMWDWIEEESGGWIEPPRSHLNRRDADTDDYKLYIKLRELIYNNEDYLTALKEFYRDDYRLLEKVK